MGTTPDYYRILQVDRSASPEELKKSYRRLAMECHPDRCPDDPEASERFKQLTAAYQVLSNPQRRAHYDRFGVDPESSGHSSMPFSTVDIESFVSFFEGLFGDIFTSTTGSHMQARDVRVDIDIDLETAALGGTVDVKVPRPQICSECGGSGAKKGTSPETCQECNGRGTVSFQTGFFAMPRTCSYCGGRGKIVKDACTKCGGRRTVIVDEDLSVDIPAGVETGSTRIFQGMGEPGLDGAVSGDLHVVVHVLRHKVFRREGRDIHVDKLISFPQAVLGDVVQIDTIEGTVKMKIEPGTQPGRVYRIRGRGISGRGMRRGDQFVHVQIDVPVDLSESQKQMVKDLGDELGNQVTPQRRSFREKLRNLME